MTLSPERKRIADRILKLLALANSTTFAAEAASARHIAEELMQAHNISLGPGKPSQDNIEMRYYEPFAKGARWEGVIVDALAKLCTCNAFFNPNTLDSYNLVGAIGNLDALEYMLHEITRQRVIAWNNYKATRGADTFYKFCYGFAQALNEKVSVLTAHGTVQQQIQREIRTWYETNIIKGTIENHSLSVGSASSKAGLEAGKNASLHRGALGQAQKQLGKR